jgi:hypothetical protein
MVWLRKRQGAEAGEGGLGLYCSDYYLRVITKHSEDPQNWIRYKHPRARKPTVKDVDFAIA